MPQYTTPGVMIEEISVGPPPIEGVASAVCLFVGPTLEAREACDPAAQSAPIESLAEFERRYGGLDDAPHAAGPVCNYVAHAARAFFDNGGRRLYVARVAPDASIADYAAALEGAREFVDVAIVAAPGCAARADGPEIQQVLLNHVEARDRGRPRFAVLDAPPHATVAEVLAVRQNAESPHAAIYYPWIVADDPRAPAGSSQAREVLLPPSGFICGVYARVDAARGVWKPPAAESLAGARRLEHDMDASECDLLAAAGVNCVRSLPARGVVVWGARTMSQDQEWKYVNVRRYINYLETSIESGLRWVVFEPNDEKLWAAVRLSVANFLLADWRNAALMGVTPEEGFFVRCDRTTMTQDDIDSGRLVVLIGAALLRPAEFVIFRIGQWTAERCESC